MYKILKLINEIVFTVDVCQKMKTESNPDLWIQESYLETLKRELWNLIMLQYDSLSEELSQLIIARA